MKIYRTEMMTSASYNEYMMGGYNYHVEYFDVEAETLEQAVAIAKKENPDRYVNQYHAREVTKREHTTNCKDRVLAHIARLKKELANAKEDLRKLEERG